METWIAGMVCLTIATGAVCVIVNDTIRNWAEIKEALGIGEHNDY